MPLQELDLILQGATKTSNLKSPQELGISSPDEPSFTSRAVEGTKQAFREGVDRASEAREKFESGEPVEGALKTFQAGVKAVTSPFVGVAGAIAEPISRGFGNLLEIGFKKRLGEEEGAKAVEGLKKEFATDVQEIEELYEQLPDNSKTAVDTVMPVLDVVGAAEGLNIIKSVVKGIAKKAPIVADVVSRTAKNESGYLARAFENLRLANTAKDIKATEKLATEILQPKKADIQLAKMAGDSTSEPVKEFIKIVKETDNWDDAVKNVINKTDTDFKLRNKLIKENNFDIDINRPLKELEESIVQARKKGLSTEAELNAMEEVLTKEREWLSKNKPNRSNAQLRKEDIYDKASPVYKKISKGNYNFDDAGRAEAYRLLGKGYKEVVEAGDSAIKALNSTYGARLGVLEMLASRGALADKALSPTLTQKLAKPITQLISRSTGAGSASFVANLAMDQQKSLLKLTKDLISLKEKGRKAGLVSSIANIPKATFNKGVELLEKSLKKFAKDLPETSSEVWFKKIDKVKQAKTKEQVINYIKELQSDIKQLPVGTENVSPTIQLGTPKTPRTPLFDDTGAKISSTTKKAGRLPNLQGGGLRKNIKPPLGRGVTPKTKPERIYQPTISEKAPIPSLVKEAKKYKSAEEFVKAQEAPIAQHKLLGDVRDLEGIKQEGFREGFNVNALPISRGGSPTNIIDIKYGAKKGDTLIVVPKSQITETPNGYKVKKGFKPNDSQIIKVTQDYQDVLSTYKSQLTDIWKQARGKATTVEGKLIQEAKKYKSADEFVKAQGTPVYHGTNAKFKVFDKNKIGSATDEGLYGRGFYFGNTRHFAEVAPRGRLAKNIMKVYLDKDIKLFDIAKIKNLKQMADLLDMSESALISESSGVIRPVRGQVGQFTSHLKSLNYDGVVVNRGGDAIETVVFEPNKIKTEAQLTDIWKKANQGGVSKATKGLSKADAKSPVVSKIDYDGAEKKLKKEYKTSKPLDDFTGFITTDGTKIDINYTKYSTHVRILNEAGIPGDSVTFYGRYGGIRLHQTANETNLQMGAKPSVKQLKQLKNLSKKKSIQYDFLKNGRIEKSGETTFENLEKEITSFYGEPY